MYVIHGMDDMTEICSPSYGHYCLFTLSFDGSVCFDGSGT